MDQILKGLQRECATSISMQQKLEIEQMKLQNAVENWFLLRHDLRKMVNSRLPSLLSV